MNFLPLFHTFKWILFRKLGLFCKLPQKGLTFEKISFFLFWVFLFFKWIYLSRKPGRSAANEIKVFIFSTTAGGQCANVLLRGQWPHLRVPGLPRELAAVLPDHHGVCYSATVYVWAFCNGTCCPPGNKPRPSQMHTRVCKLNFILILDIEELFLNLCDTCCMTNTRGLAFSPLLQLNTWGQNLKVTKARRSTQWNFQSDEPYHLPSHMQKRGTEERVH